MHNNHCHRVTAQLQLINIIIIIIIIIICYRTVSVIRTEWHQLRGKKCDIKCV